MNKEKISLNSYSNNSNINNNSTKLLDKSNSEINNKVNLIFPEEKIDFPEMTNNDISTMNFPNINSDLEIQKFRSEYSQNKYKSNKFTSSKRNIKKKKTVIHGQFKFHNLLPNLELKKNSNYKFGFDISPIITNKTPLQIIRLTMCKGELKLNISNTVSNPENSSEYKNKNLQISNSLTEYGILKSLNYICGNMEVLNLVYYKSKYRGNDKSLSSFFIDKIYEIEKPIEKIFIEFMEKINKSLGYITIDIIKEKDKYLCKIIIDMITEKNDIKNIDMIVEKDKSLGKKIIDLLSEKDKNIANFAKYIIDVIAEKDKKLAQIIIEMIKNKPLDKNYIEQIPKTDKILLQQIIDIFKEKNKKAFCQKIIDLTAEKDKILGKMIFDKISEKDKPLGKMIIDMIAEKDNSCCKCNNIMSNHFYYLYSPNFSRIKIDFISVKDSNLEKIIGFIDKEKDLKQEGYNLDIFSYGFCKKCKEIVTPLIKMPKDLFNYSSAKFFNHIFNNEETFNRNDVKEFNISRFIVPKKCCHSSFHDINRIFVTRYGALKFQYEKLRKYDLISVQNIPDINKIKFYEPKEIDSLECLEIISLIKDNLVYELEEIKNIETIISEKNITIFNTINSQGGGSPMNIIDITLNFLNNLIDYLKEDNIDNSSNLSSKNIRENCTSIKSDADLSQLALKGKILSTENSSEYWEESNNKKDLPKSSNSEKEKNFPIAIINLFLKINEESSKKMGLLKRIFFKIVQIKILYNKIRSIINIIKIFISLELIIKDEENKNKIISKFNKSELNNIISNNKDKNNKNQNNENNKNINGINNNDNLKAELVPSNKVENEIKGIS